MKHNRLFLTLAAAGIAVATVSLSAADYMRARTDQTTFKGGATGFVRPAATTHQVPFLSAPAFTNRASEAEAPTLRGLVVNGNTPYICEFKAQSGLILRNIYSDPYMEEASGGAFYAEGKYYILTVEQMFGTMQTNMTVYDAETWDIIEERADLLPSSAAYCVTYDPLTGAAYGYFMNDDLDSTWQMYGRMNLATGEVLGLNNVDSNEGFLAIAPSTDGYLYAVNATGMYCRIAKDTGVVTKLGHTDVKPQFVQSAVIDPATGIFYWAGFTDEGKGGLYAIDPDTFMASLISPFPANQEIVGLYIVDNRTEAEMPAEVLDLDVRFVRDTMNCTVSFTAPDVYGDGKKLPSTITAHVAVDGKHYEKPVAPGAKASFDISVKSGGIHNTAAWVSVASSAGNKKYVQKWVGADRPTGVRNLKATVDGTKVQLSWEAPAEGQHGGYVDPAAITYIIDRDGYGFRHERDYTGTTFVDDLGEDVSADVRYSVRPVYKDMGGYTSYTETIHVGPMIMEVPLTLSPSGDFNKFLVIDANNDGNTWEASWGGYALYESGDEAGDDWMLTPQIKLESGRVYELEYQASAKMGLMSPEVIEVKVGAGDTPADMTTLIDSQNIKSIGITKFNTYTATFTVPVSGIYRVGFHALSDSQQMGLSIISIKSAAASAGPAASTALSVTAAPLGELKADVTFTLPEKNSNNEALTGISKVELYNGSRLAASASGVTPGASCTLTDTEAQQGLNNYSVVAYGTDGSKGMSASVSGWVGLDIPQLPTNFDIYEKGNAVHLSWKLPATGLNGGYVDPAGVVYSIIEPSFGAEYGSVKGVNEVDLPFNNLNEQISLTLGLMVANTAGANPDGVLSPTIKVGPAYTLPFHENFGRNTDYAWSVLGEADDDLSGWSPEEDTVGPDGQAGVSSYYGELPSDVQMLASGKISIPAGSDATLRMWLKGRGGGMLGGDFNILVSEEFSKNYKPIFTRTFTADSDFAWKPVEVSMKPYAGKTIYLALQGAPSEDGSVLIGIDDLTISVPAEHDAAVTSFIVDRDEVEVSESKATVKAWVANVGTKPMTAGSYTVDFYAGDRKFASLPGEAMDALFGISTYTAEYLPTTDDTDPTELYARVNYDNDADLSNNTSAKQQIYVVVPELPAAQELTAAATESGIALDWKAADTSGKPVRTVTDDFESYRTFDNNRAGKWTIVDEDQSPGISVSYFFPGSAGALGWVVMEPQAVPTVEGTLADRMPAYSGEKYMVAYRPSSRDNKDWLITPELSGNAQEISFMARAESVNQGREMFEVYYSTTGTALSDFISLDAVSHRTEPEGWSEFKFQVPAGAKYFAVRCVSHSRMAMHIDYFTYESAPTPVEGTLLGYNVYRDGELLNEAPTTATTYLDTNAPAGDHTYVVRAVYDRGEAPASNQALMSTTGIETIEASIDPAVVPVYDLSGLRVYTLQEGNIYVARGKRFVFRKH